MRRTTSPRRWATGGCPCSSTGASGCHLSFASATRPVLPAFPPVFAQYYARLSSAALLAHSALPALLGDRFISPAPAPTADLRRAGSRELPLLVLRPPGRPHHPERYSPECVTRCHEGLLRSPAPGPRRVALRSTPTPMASHRMSALPLSSYHSAERLAADHDGDHDRARRLLLRDLWLRFL